MEWLGLSTGEGGKHRRIKYTVRKRGEKKGGYFRQSKLGGGGLLKKKKRGWEKSL